MTDKSRVFLYILTLILIYAIVAMIIYINGMGLEDENRANDLG